MSCTESCSNVVCPGTHTCVTDQTNSAHCVMCRTTPCPIAMPSEQPICGNDNITYPSACHLRRATCFLGRSIGVRHYGHCNSKATKTPVTFYFYQSLTCLCQWGFCSCHASTFWLFFFFLCRSPSETSTFRRQWGKRSLDGQLLTQSFFKKRVVRETLPSVTPLASHNDLFFWQSFPPPLCIQNDNTFERPLLEDTIV